MGRQVIKYEGCICMCMRTYRLTAGGALNQESAEGCEESTNHTHRERVAPPVHVHVHVRGYACACAWICVRMCVDMRAHVRGYVCACAWICVCMCVCVCMRICKRICMCMCTLPAGCRRVKEADGDDDDD